MPGWKLGRLLSCKPVTIFEGFGLQCLTTYEVNHREYHDPNHIDEVPIPGN
jgi:hypothetical protein